MGSEGFIKRNWRQAWINSEMHFYFLFFYFQSSPHTHKPILAVINNSAQVCDPYHSLSLATSSIHKPVLNHTLTSTYPYHLTGTGAVQPTSDPHISIFHAVQTMAHKESEGPSQQIVSEGDDHLWPDTSFYCALLAVSH